MCDVAHGDPRDAEPHAVALGERVALAIEQIEHAAADDAAADHADPDLAHAAARRRRRTRARGAVAPRERAVLAKQRGELVLIGEERVVAVLGVELPQRAARAGGLQLAIELVLERVREQQIAGHADDRARRRSRARARRAPLPRSAPNRQRSIASLSSRNVRTGNRCREPLAVMIEVRGDRRLRELGREHAEPRVELVAAAIRQHAELACARHAGRDIAGAQAVAHELALEVTRRRAPAVGAQARRRS